MSLNLSPSNAVLHTQRNIEYEILSFTHSCNDSCNQTPLNIYTSTKLKP